MFKRFTLAVVLALVVILPGFTPTATPSASAAIDGCNVSATHTISNTHTIYLQGSAWCSNYQSLNSPSLTLYMCGGINGNGYCYPGKKVASVFWGSSGVHGWYCTKIYTGPYWVYVGAKVQLHNGQSEWAFGPGVWSQGSC
jgi:hypothetical protein